MTVSGDLAHRLIAMEGDPKYRKRYAAVRRDA